MMARAWTDGGCYAAAKPICTDSMLERALLRSSYAATDHGFSLGRALPQFDEGWGPSAPTAGASSSSRDSEDSSFTSGSVSGAVPSEEAEQPSSNIPLSSMPFVGAGFACSAPIIAVAAPAVPRDCMVARLQCVASRCIYHVSRVLLYIDFVTVSKGHKAD